MTPNSISRRGKLRGFTMTELMVVIVIVSILATIGFAVASRVRKKANGMKCLARLKDWSQVFSQASMDLGGNRMYCPANWASIGSGIGGYPSSPFLLYWAEFVGIDGDERRTLGDFTANDLTLIRDYQQKVRSCPCLTVGRSASGNAGTSYMFNRNLANGFGMYGPTRVDVIRLNEIPRASKKIYFMDGRATGPLNIPARAEAVDSVKQVEESHGGKVNAVFLDMHLEQLTAGDLETEWDELVRP